jgi:RNA polymerase sigma-70 factor, ECF subfamily
MKVANIAEAREANLDDTLPKAIGGDPAAFASILRAHQAMVFSLAYHVLRDRGQAEDLAQEVFLLLHRNLAALKSTEHLIFWLRKVTCHRAIDQARRRRFWPRLSLEQAPEPAAASTVRDSMLDRTLGRMVESLPERQRAIIVLRYQEDLEPAEIAEVLGMPVATVKSYLQRALALLRQKLGRVGERRL